MPRLMITLTHLICCYKDGGRGAWVTPLPCQGIHNCSSFLHHLLCSSNWPVTSIKPSRKKESLLQHISTLTCLHGWPKREQDSQDILLPPQACWHLESVQSLSTGRLGNIGPITCPTFRPSAPFPVRTQTQVLVVKNFQPTMVFTLVISLALWGNPYHNAIYNLSDGDWKAWTFAIHSQLYAINQVVKQKEHCFVTWLFTG